jgi:hypothetical protein
VPQEIEMNGTIGRVLGKLFTPPPSGIGHAISAFRWRDMPINNRPMNPFSTPTTPFGISPNSSIVDVVINKPKKRVKKKHAKKKGKIVRIYKY